MKRPETDDNGFAGQPARSHRARQGRDVGPPLRDLAEGATGTYSVCTMASTYVLDMDARTLMRLPNAAEAADLRRDCRTVELLRLEICIVGLPMVAVIDLHVPGVSSTTRCTTPVVSIRKLDAGELT